MATILIVEDDADLRTCYELALTGHGHRVTLAANGFEALKVLATESTPDLIVLDLQMPVMDGWEFLERLRETPILRTTPVCVATASTVACVDDAVAVLRKPFPLASLLSVVDHYSTRGSHRAEDQPRSDP